MRNKNTFLSDEKLRHLIREGDIIILRDEADEIEYRFAKRSIRWIERKDARGYAKATQEWRRSACYWHYKSKMAEHWKQSQQESLNQKQ